MLETIFGPTITLSSGRIIPTRYVGEQHVQQDLGFIPSFADWLRAIRPLPWMGRAGRLDDRLALAEAVAHHAGNGDDRSMRVGALHPPAPKSERASEKGMNPAGKESARPVHPAPRSRRSRHARDHHQCPRPDDH
jgi:hypothetical protein